MIIKVHTVLSGSVNVDSFDQIRYSPYGGRHMMHTYVIMRHLVKRSNIPPVLGIAAS